MINYDNTTLYTSIITKYKSDSVLLYMLLFIICCCGSIILLLKYYLKIHIINNGVVVPNNDDNILVETNAVNIYHVRNEDIIDCNNIDIKL